MNNRLDLVAAQVAKVGDEVGAVRDAQAEQSEDLDRIERTLTAHLDRLDDHGQRIEALEAKSGTIPSPTPRR